MAVTAYKADPGKPYKAIAAFILTFAGLVFQAVVDKGDGSITTREWVVIIVGSLLTTATVYGISNPIVQRAQRSKVD